MYDGVLSWLWVKSNFGEKWEGVWNILGADGEDMIPSHNK